MERRRYAALQSSQSLRHHRLHAAGVQAGGHATLEAAEREHILRVLRETGWVIGGPKGAAARLGMNRSTLNSRLRKLGISRPRKW